MDAQKWTNGCVVPLAWCAVANDPINITNIYCKGITHHPPFKKTSNLTDHGGSTLRFWWTNPSTNIVSACRPHKNCLLEKTPSSTNIMSVCRPPKPQKICLKKQHPHKLSGPKSPATLHRLCTTTTDGCHDPSRASVRGTIAGSFWDRHGGRTLVNNRYLEDHPS